MSFVVMACRRKERILYLYLYIFFLCFFNKSCNLFFWSFVQKINKDGTRATKKLKHKRRRGRTNMGCRSMCRCLVGTQQAREWDWKHRLAKACSSCCHGLFRCPFSLTYIVANYGCCSYCSYNTWVEKEKSSSTNSRTQETSKQKKPKKFKTRKNLPLSTLNNKKRFF